jgi:hypothetical protein
MRGCPSNGGNRILHEAGIEWRSTEAVFSVVVGS